MIRIIIIGNDKIIHIFYSNFQPYPFCLCAKRSYNCLYSPNCCIIVTYVILSVTLVSGTSFDSHSQLASYSFDEQEIISRRSLVSRLHFFELSNRLRCKRSIMPLFYSCHRIYIILCLASGTMLHQCFTKIGS